MEVAEIGGLLDPLFGFVNERMLARESIV